MNTEEPRSWRELLGNAVSDPQERLRIAEALGINPITLTRWVAGKSNPRPDNLRPLLDALPAYRKQLIESITEDYPHIFNEANLASSLLKEIPSAFYARVLNAHTTSPPVLRASAVYTLILQQMLEHLDPDQMGLVIAIVQCVPPGAGGKVRSLRKMLARGNPPWTNHENQTMFLGAESQVGHALISGHFSVVQTREQIERMFPIHHSTKEESAVAYPILLADRTAGCLAIASTQCHYFMQPHLDLIGHYVDLMVLAFEEHEFYHLSDIELGMMPHRDKQYPYLVTFQQRVTQRMIEAMRAQHPITRPQAELQIWRELEEELLKLPLDSHE